MIVRGDSVFFRCNTYYQACIYLNMMAQVPEMYDVSNLILYSITWIELQLPLSKEGNAVLLIEKHHYQF